MSRLLRWWTLGASFVLEVGMLQAAPIYSITPTGLILADRMNDSGQVVGEDYSFHAVVWDPVTGLRDLSALPGTNQTFGYDINNSGWVAGVAYGNPGGPHEAMLWDADGSPQVLGGNNWTPTCVNDVGQVNGGGNLWDSVNGRRDFLTVSGGLPPPRAGAELYNTAMNDLGQIAGNWLLAGADMDDPASHGLFLWDPIEGMRDLGLVHVGPSSPTVRDLNNSGQLVGSISLTDETQLAFVTDSGGTVQMLPTFGVDHAYALAINDDGEVVGAAELPTGVQSGFIWDAVNGLRDLNDLIDSGSGWEVGSGLDINESGQIFAIGHNVLDDRHVAIVLTPIPEPGSVFVMTLIALALASVRR